MKRLAGLSLPLYCLTMELSEKQKKFLRGQGHALSPLARLGSAGVTDGFMAELDRTLTRHELVKVKLNGGNRTDRESALGLILAGSGATLVTRIGNVAVLYRPAPEPRLVLPPR